MSELEEIVLRNSPFPTLDAYVENQRLFDAAFEHLSAHRYEEAASLFEKVLEQNPDHVQSYGNLGLALAGLGHKAAALESLDKALTLDPDYTPARINRKIIATMQEGQPHRPDEIAETEFYREKAEAESSRKSGSPPKPKWWSWGRK